MLPTVHSSQLRTGKKNMANILLIDDRVDILKRVSSALEGAGHTVTALYHTEGVEVLIRTARPAFDIIVCDNDVDHFDDGINLAKQLRGQRCTLPFILHTGCTLRQLESYFDFETHNVTYVPKATYDDLLIERVAKNLAATQ